MMSYIVIGSPFGIVLGYAITMFLIRAKLSWELSFIIQACVFGVFAIITLFLPKIYFSTSIKCLNPPNYLEEKDSEKIKQTPNDANTGRDAHVISLFGMKEESDSKIKNFWRDLCILIRVKVIFIIFKF